MQTASDGVLIHNAGGQCSHPCFLLNLPGQVVPDEQFNIIDYYHSFLAVLGKIALHLSQR